MRKNYIIAGIFIATLFLQNSSSAQALRPDSLFGFNGKAEVAVGGGESVTGLLIQNDGKYIVAGFEYDINCNCFYNDMVRLDVCGNIDSSFGTNGIVRHTFSQRNLGYDYKLQPDGKIVVAGQQAASNSGSGQIPFVARYTSDGQPDTTFHQTGSNAIRFDPTSSGVFYSVHVLPDGKILCGGISNTNINGGFNGPGVMRFLSNGDADPDFSNDGINVFQDMPPADNFSDYKLHIQSPGRYILAGRFRINGSQNFSTTLAFNASGQTDLTFGTAGYYNDDTPSGNTARVQSAIQSDGKVLLAADAADQNSVFVKRLTVDGALDKTFGTDGMVTLPYANGFGAMRGIQQLPDGRILLFISEENLGAHFKMHLLDPDGATDESFGSDGAVRFTYGPNSRYLNQMIILPDGQWLVGGMHLDNLTAIRLNDQAVIPHIWMDGTMLNSGLDNDELTYQWYLDGAPEPDSNHSQLFPISNGDYTLQVLDFYGCSYTSAPFTLSSVGMGAVTLDSIYIYPNPSSESFTLSGAVKGTSYELTDVSGKLFMKGFVMTQNEVISTSSAAKGVYFLKAGNHISRLVIR